ncbi:MAG: UbiD family decarboxylase [Deltaproteobacteria bacterium]|nr:UbiD family decarboxylase [Deltaproteobacteria bacterium]
MAFEDLRHFIEEARRIGELEEIHGAHWDLEIGALTEIIAERREHPALLFDSIPDYPKGYRVFTNAMTTVRRTALALDLPLESSALEVLQHWRQKAQDFKPVAPEHVDDAPVKEHVLTGRDINLFRFPTPKWHESDPGRYLGTADAVVMRDPDGQWVNVATYRMVVHDEQTLGLWISPGKHGYLFLQKLAARGESLPVAVSFGHDPTFWLTCATFYPYQASEYELAGWIRGKPMQVTRGVVTDLPIPATSEIVVEGEIPPKAVESRVEGPFGEFTGYYSVGPHPQLIMKVKSILHRSDPIIFGAPPFKFPTVWFAAVPFNAGETWDALNKAGVPDVRGVWQFGSWYPMLTVVSIRQRYAGHAKQAALVAMGSKGTAYMGRFVVVVDEDIDYTNLEDVIWAITTRCDPIHQVDIIKECWSSPIDPIVSPHMRFEMPHGTQSTSRMIINACKPYAWYDQFPKTNIASQEVRARIAAQWGGLLARLKGAEQSPRIPTPPARGRSGGGESVPTMG